MEILQSYWIQIPIGVSLGIALRLWFIKIWNKVKGTHPMTAGI